LLEFLSAGRLQTASALADATLKAEDPQHALQDKLKGPLLAVAGAIILITRSDTADRQGWDQWLDNLANWFPRIPDGKILLGCRRLQQATTKRDLVNVLCHLTDGFERGIPYFTMTIRMLSLALAQLGSDMPAAEDLRRRIGGVTARVDPDQPFTVIRF
jgi:hypothetical protein